MLLKKNYKILKNFCIKNNFQNFVCMISLHCPFMWNFKVSGLIELHRSRAGDRNWGTGQEEIESVEKVYKFGSE